MDILIDAAALKDRLDATRDTGQRTVLLDVRWALGDPHGHDHYLREHIPGAVFVDLATELAGPRRPQSRTPSLASAGAVPAVCAKLGRPER